MAVLAFAREWAYLLLPLALVLGVAAHALQSPRWLGVALLSGAVWSASAGLFSAFFPLARSAVQGAGWRLLGCAAAYLALRAVFGHWRRASGKLLGVYEGFGLHLASIGALMMSLPGYLDRPLPSGMMWPGYAVLAVAVATVSRLGWLQTAVLYAAAGVLRLEFRVLDSLLPLAAGIFLTLLATGLVLRQLRRRAPDRA